MAAEPQSDGASRRSPNWVARRDAIVDTSARVFAQNGYHATGINELCAANELGKGALYHYIGSKEQLLAAIHDRVMDHVLASGTRVATSTGTPTEKLVQLGEELLDIITLFPDHVWVFLHEFPALTGERAETFRERRREYEKDLENVIAAGIKAGEFRKVEPRLTALAWLGMHNYTYLWWKPDHKLMPRDIARRFADIFIDGIRA